MSVSGKQFNRGDGTNGEVGEEFLMLGREAAGVLTGRGREGLGWESEG